MHSAQNCVQRRVTDIDKTNAVAVTPALFTKSREVVLQMKIPYPCQTRPSHETALSAALLHVGKVGEASPLSTHLSLFSQSAKRDMAEDDSRGADLGPDVDDDEALRYAIALSLEEPDNKAERKGKAASTGPEVPPRKATFGSLSLDRRHMEEERLLRLSRKRQRSPSDGEITEVPGPKRKVPIEDLATSPKPSLTYPNGAVKRTWVRGNKRSSTDITIEEVFQKEYLSLAVLSSFQWDDEWLLSKLDLRNSKLLLLAFAADNAQVHTFRSATHQRPQ